MLVSALDQPETDFRMPAEWEPHRATWLAWPHNHETWPHNRERAVDEFVTLVEVIARSEIACVLASGDALDEARSRLRHSKNVELLDIPTNDAWVRDYGPTFRRTNSATLSAVNWNYNGWGGKYPPFDQDQRAAARMICHLGIEETSRSIEAVVEGGAIETNGQGVLLTTQSCLLNRNRIGDRSPRRVREELVSVFAESLGVKKVYWLMGADLPGDDTDGHIDQLVRFVNATSVVVASSGKSAESRSRLLVEKLRYLRQELEASESISEVHDLPLPMPISVSGMRIPASYANFYFTNAHLLVPQFGDRSADQRACEILQELIPDREILGLPSAELTYGLGSFHCLTQQEPEMTDADHVIS